MIASLTGTVEDYTDNGVVLNVNGVGFAVQTSADAIQVLASKGQDEVVHLFTYLAVGRDGDLNLFGFLSKDELSLFKKLITVSGIGPKGALSILSVMSADDLVFAILSGDSKTISRAPGIGKKTAERLVIDLRDKLELKTAEDLADSPYAAADGLAGAGGAGGLGISGSGAGAADGQGAAADAVEALTALGYARAEAVKAVRQAKAERDADLEAAGADGSGTGASGGAGAAVGDETEALLKGALTFLS